MIPINDQNLILKEFNFWKVMDKPIFCLAPMEEVTDVAFREMFAKYSKQQTADSRQHQNHFVMFTEFVNVDGLTHPVGFEKLKVDLKFTEIQRPIVAQIWGNNPDKFYEAAKIVVNLGFDGIDINMGCPQDKEIAQKTCAYLIREPKLAQEIIFAVKKGVESADRRIPVSVKTRIGYSQNEVGTWIRNLLETDIAALTVHGRTKQEKSKVPAHWDAIAEAVELRNEMKSQTLIIGNGDVKSRQEGLSRVKETGVDGIMIARGAFGNPWMFRFGEENPTLNKDEVFPLPTSPLAPASPFQGLVSREVNSLTNKLSYVPTIKERLSVMLEHAELFDKEFSGIKSFYIMRKHFKAYASGFDGASELRAKLMEAQNLEETKKIVTEFLEKI